MGCDGRFFSTLIGSRECNPHTSRFILACARVRVQVCSIFLMFYYGVYHPLSPW